MSLSLLPDLERELIAAAERLEPRRTPRRRPWMRGWVLFSALLATTGVGVATARITHFGPFDYLDRSADENPLLRPASSISVEPGGEAPAWTARAYLNHVGQLCISGGPRDQRTNPSAPPTEGNLNNAPAAVLSCFGAEEAAQSLVDPDWPGATVAGNAPLDGSPDVNVCMDDGQGNCVPVSDDYPTRMLVYAVAPAGLTPAVRWGAKGDPTAMQASSRHLRMEVDKSPAGLSKAEFARISTYPDSIDLVLWAAEVKIPDGVTQSQVLTPWELPPHGVDDATVEMLTSAEMSRLIKQGQESGWKMPEGIKRDPQPVKRETDTQRRKIAAFARPRTDADAVPESEHPKYGESNLLGYAVSRKLTISGGGVRQAWLVPGGIPPEQTFGNRPTDLTCVIGATIFGDCKLGADDWKQPLVEAVSCSRGFSAEESFVWALSPPGAKGIELLRKGAEPEELPLAELVALRRNRADQPDALRWVMAKGAPVVVSVPWPKSGPAKCGTEPPEWSALRRDSVGGSRSSGGPRAVRR